MTALVLGRPTTLTLSAVGPIDVNKGYIYLKTARRLSIDYGLVLAYSDLLERRPTTPLQERAVKLLTYGQKEEILSVFQMEQVRRRLVVA